MALFSFNISRLVKVISFLSIGVYAWPLIFKIPRTLRILFEAFRPGGYGIADKDFWAFSRVDAGFRPWYTKIARDYETQGRFGYVWDDGLGMPLGVRIYNNLGTYKILYWLGHRRMMALGYTLMLLSNVILVSSHFGLLIGVLTGLIAAGSPLLIASYTHFGKPEMFWWAFTIPVIYLGLAGQGLWAGLGWSILTVFNLSVSYMIILLLGPALLIALFLHGTLLVGLAGVIPGIGKNIIRLTYMWRSGFMGRITSEQARLWKRPLRPQISELILWFPFLLSVALATYVSASPIVGIFIIIFGIGVNWFNYRVIYLNDPQSFNIAFWVIGLVFACISHSLCALLAIALMLYVNPNLYGFPLPEAETNPDMDKLERWMSNVNKAMRIFPALAPLSLPRPTELMHFFDQIPNGARLIAESDGDPRTKSRFRAFWQWTEEFLPARQIDLVSEMYTRAVEPELVDKYLTPFNAQQMTLDEMKRICQTLGVSYIVTYTKETAALLEEAGYHSIASVNLATLDDFLAAIANVPPVELNLFKISTSETIIAPAVSWSLKANELTWSAHANQAYVIRYRYSPEFRAYQNGQALAVTPIKPMSDLPLRFMQVTAVMDGPITLKFHPRWL